MSHGRGVAHEFDHYADNPLKVDLRDGACKGSPPPSGNGAYSNEQIARDYEEAFCIECPVMFPCLEQGIAGDERGIWGGLTRDERRAIKAQREAS